MAQQYQALESGVCPGMRSTRSGGHKTTSILLKKRKKGRSRILSNESSRLVTASRSKHHKGSKKRTPLSAAKKSFQKDLQPLYDTQTYMFKNRNGTLKRKRLSLEDPKLLKPKRKKRRITKEEIKEQLRAKRKRRATLNNDL